MRHLIAFLLLLFYNIHAQENPTCIKAGKFFDGKSYSLRENVLILIEGNRIVDVGEKINVPQNATIVDLSDRTVMPGLIDAHTHIALHPGSYAEQIMKESTEFRAIYATVNAKATLEAGVTTIRDLGNEGSGLADMQSKKASFRAREF